MNISPKKMIVGAVLIVVALALFLVLKPDASKDEGGLSGQTVAIPTGAGGAVTGKNGQEPEPAKPALPVGPVIRFENGEVVGGVQKIEVSEGDTVRFTVRSDIEDEVHVHGFDVSKEVGPGKPARLDFKAGFTGVFEIELENSGVPIIELQVNP